VITCTHLDEPGILCDMVNALKLRFNGERVYVPLRGTTLTYEENELFYRLVIDRLADVSETLLPLFYYDKDKNIESGIGVYLIKYINLTADDLFSNFYNSLRDVNRLKQTIYVNYVSADCPEVFDMASVPRIKEKVFTADLPADVKMYLLNFLLFGESEIEKIISEFQKAEAFCRELHKVHADEKNKLAALYGENTVEELSRKHVIDVSSYENVYFTFALIFSEAIYCETYGKACLSILGLSIAKKIEIANGDFYSFSVNLYELGRILYDETRLKILDMLLEEQMYCAQIAKILNLKNNSTLYHLGMMEREGLIKQTGTGKKKYYCINQGYLAQIKNLIDSKFTGDSLNEQ